MSRHTTAQLDRIETKKAKELMAQERWEALAHHMFQKSKKTGQVKGHGCTDSRKQRAYTDKDKATSPTIATEAVFLTAVIDAMNLSTLYACTFAVRRRSGDRRQR